VSQRELDDLAAIDVARERALLDDNISHRETRFSQAMRALAQLERNRNAFIREAFKRGRGEFRLDDEAIRPLVLPILHSDFDRAQYIGGADQRAYEEGLKQRDDLPKSTTDAIDFLLKQDDQARLEKFMEGRPRGEVEKIIAYIEKIARS
jgi:hypothetical protein